MALLTKQFAPYSARGLHNPPKLCSSIPSRRNFLTARATLPYRIELVLEESGSHTRLHSRHMHGRQCSSLNCNRLLPQHAWMEYSTALIRALHSRLKSSRLLPKDRLDQGSKAFDSSRISRSAARPPKIQALRPESSAFLSSSLPALDIRAIGGISAPMAIQSFCQRIIIYACR